MKGDNMEGIITLGAIEAFLTSKKNAERSKNTLLKYRHDLMRLFEYLEGKKEVGKQTLIAYKDELCAKYKPTSVNSVLVAINGLLTHLGLGEYKLQLLKIQRNSFRDPNRELSKEEYERLLAEAAREGNQRLLLIMQTICSTGIRVSELKNITVEAARAGRALVSNKGKTRYIFLAKNLCKQLLKYAGNQGISRGHIFITSKGKPLDRSNIWREMKNLCERAGVDKNKVFPHNLRHLFAYTFYALEKDIVRLADILGHSDLSTTQRYTMTSGDEHERQINRLGLLLCP
jgi:site-specific recombinase XerD